MTSRQETMTIYASFPLSVKTDSSFRFRFFRFLSAASRIRYEITSGNIGGAFAVKNMTGAIYVAGALDYETRKRVSIHTPTYTHIFLAYRRAKAYDDRDDEDNCGNRDWLASDSPIESLLLCIV